MSTLIDKDQLSKEIDISTSRASGAGGQNVNKVETKVTLKYDLTSTTVFDEVTIQKLKNRLAKTLINDQYIQVYDQTSRTQLKNKENAFKKLVKLLEKALIDPIPRKETKPSADAIAKRLTEKKKRAEVKEGRNFRLDN